MKTSQTTICYIEKDGCYLMLHRNKEKNDINEGKWLGIGGHLEEGETPEDANIREVFEETGLKIKTTTKRATLYFHQGDIHEIMHLFTCNDFEGELIECNEGTLKWIPISDVPSLNLWEGDRAFLKELLVSDKYFEMSFTYEKDKLIDYKRVK